MFENFKKKVEEYLFWLLDLQRLQDNIENVLGSIDNVVGYHHVAKRQKDLIAKGVQGTVFSILFCEFQNNIQMDIYHDKLKSILKTF